MRPTLKKQSIFVVESKKIEANDIYSLVTELKLDYGDTEKKELIEELGLTEEASIEFDNLINKSREKRKKSKFKPFYENLINFLTTPSEMILFILNEAKAKLESFQEDRLADEINWVIQKIKNEEIYNVTINQEELSIGNDNKYSGELENTMKLISEYSTDHFTRNKKEDIIAARIIGTNRFSSYEKTSEKKQILRKSVKVNNYATGSKLHLITSPVQYNSNHHFANSLSTFKIHIDEDHEEKEKIEKSISNESEKQADVSIIDDSYEKEPTPFDFVTFNIFEYVDTYQRQNCLQNIANYVFNYYNLFVIINTNTFDSFLHKIRVGYDFLLPYHNEIHAADVLQTCHVLALNSGVQSEMDLTILDLSGLFVATIIHDYKHPGKNNNFLINSRSELALKYNDVSVLENYHVSSAFKVISHKNSNIFCDLKNEEFRVVRKRIVECVLSTDMAKHAKTISSIKIKLENFRTNNKNGQTFLQSLVSEGSESAKFDRRQEILNYFIHCGDISNGAKPEAISQKWTNLVIQEFFEQGDQEKILNLPVSFLCDREKTNIPQSQLSFITNIVAPCFSLLSQICLNLKFFLDYSDANAKYWESQIEGNK